MHFFPILFKYIRFWWLLENLASWSYNDTGNKLFVRLLISLKKIVIFCYLNGIKKYFQLFSSNEEPSLQMYYNDKKIYLFQFLLHLAYVTSTSRNRNNIPMIYDAFVLLICSLSIALYHFHPVLLFLGKHFSRIPCNFWIFSTSSCN